MYTRLLIPLDGSKTAEKVLPYARFLARTLKLTVELLEVIDIAEIATHVSPEKAQFVNTVIENRARRSEQYLRGVAGTFPGANVKCTVEKGTAAEVIIEKAAADKGTLISMATHGRSGINRWLLGSVAEKVLRGATNPLLLIRATEEAKTEGKASLRTVIVPLDGSELAEQMLPTVAESAMKKLGVDKVSCVAEYGLAADEIISFARKTPDNLIAMCTHGHSGVKRWMLGSVTETVVRHSGDPVLVIRPT
jgi:nucleotide-binding universal stress UspA family protein